MTALDCSADVLLKTRSDLEGLKGCQVFTGKITISQVPVEELVIPGVQEIRGDLRFTDINSVTKISLPELKSVSGSLAFESVRDVHVISMPKLTAVGNFVLSVAPALTVVDFSGGLSQANAITISDTTATEIRGIGVTKVVSLVVDNNHYLKNANLSSITDIAESVKIGSNAPGFAVDVRVLKGKGVYSVTMGSTACTHSLTSPTAQQSSKLEIRRFPTHRWCPSLRFDKSRWRFDIYLKYF
jgi:hypothetical protein